MKYSKEEIARWVELIRIIRCTVILDQVQELLRGEVDHDAVVWKIFDETWDRVQTDLEQWMDHAKAGTFPPEVDFSTYSDNTDPFGHRLR